jgi:hypothetical protein
MTYLLEESDGSVKASEAEEIDGRPEKFALNVAVVSNSRKRVYSRAYQRDGAWVYRYTRDQPV